MSHCNTDKFNNFWICEPLARCAKLGSNLPLGTPMEIDFTSAYLHYPLPQCSKIVTPIIFSISYELFRLPSAKVPQDYQLLRTFVWCLMEKLTRNNGPFLDTCVGEWITYTLTKSCRVDVSCLIMISQNVCSTFNTLFSYLLLSPADMLDVSQEDIVWRTTRMIPAVKWGQGWLCLKQKKRKFICETLICKYTESTLGL